MPKPGDLQRNHQMVVVADRDAPCWWRDFMPGLYPKGGKQLRMVLQAENGWVTMTPHPDNGFLVTHAPRLTQTSGIWLKGPMAGHAGRYDVKLARLLLGHRVWDVSTPRVWVYRAFVSSAIFTAMSALSIDLGTLGNVLAPLSPLLIKSPCTPRGVIMWCQSKEFATQALRPDLTGVAGDDVVARQIQSAGSSHG